KRRPRDLHARHQSRRREVEDSPRVVDARAPKKLLVDRLWNQDLIEERVEPHELTEMGEPNAGARVDDYSSKLRHAPASSSSSDASQSSHVVRASSRVTA